MELTPSHTGDGGWGACVCVYGKGFKRGHWSGSADSGVHLRHVVQFWGAASQPCQWLKPKTSPPRQAWASWISNRFTNGSDPVSWSERLSCMKRENSWPKMLPCEGGELRSDGGFLGREKFIHCKKLMFLNILNSCLKSKCLHSCCCFLVIDAEKHCGVGKEQVVFCVFCCNLVTMRDRRALWSLPGWDWRFVTGVSSLLTRNWAMYDQTDKILDCIKDWLVKKCACIKKIPC